VVGKTYESFSRNLIGVDWKNSRAIINIDPVPPGNRDRVIQVVQQYVGTVVALLPDEPNYTEAFNSIWSMAETEYILNLEDDWALTDRIHIKDFLYFFERNPRLYEVVFRAYNYRYPCCCTSPSILHRRFYKAVAGKLDPRENPETQIHHRQDFGIFIPNKKNCRDPEKYIIAYPHHVIVKDIGREWMENSGYTRPQLLPENDHRYKKKARFTSWVKQ
jgi:hypothetical protein